MLTTILSNWNFGNLSLPVNIVIFLLMTALIAYAGTKLTHTADKLADITGLGEALIGAVLLGAMTSLPGVVTSISAAFNNHPELAASNGLGGIALQTAFLGIADITYKKVNLEHAAASYSNLMLGLLLIILLSFVLLIMITPSIDIFGFHPASVVSIVIYVAGLRLINKAKDIPMWNPKITDETVEDEPEYEVGSKKELAGLWVKFIILAITVIIGGYLVSKTGINIAEKTKLSETLVGAFFTALSTSLPELIVSVAAVRQGALTLAVGNIIGGNTFDVLFVSFSDFAYIKGSIYEMLSDQVIFIIVLTIFMNGILILGLLDREKTGVAKIGWESALMLISFILGFVLLFFW